MKNKSKMKMQAIAPRALKAGEASEYIGVSRRTLNQLTNDGRIPCCKISSRLFCYTVNDLNAFLDKCRVGGK
ncbi:helix-turn-helix domain-containing protein [Pontiellaceae bacterium B1224]|nr:helix-turn-helix domain-containing protein [Pontiellaceae bacterium B1224]